MANLNKVMLIGNLTRDPEIKYTPKGQAIAELGLAINRHYTLDSGEKREETTFVDVTLWGRQAEIAKEYLSKGKPVYIEGRLQLDTWDDKQTGQKRSKLRVTGEGLQLLGSRGEGGGGGGGGGGGYSGGSGGGGHSTPSDEYDQRPAPRAPQRPAPQSGGGKPRPAPAQPDPDEEDDIPF
jgi:single-strand DNA-binding protein